NFYNSNILACRTEALDIISLQNDLLSVNVFPNPAIDQLIVEAGDNIQTLEMVDIEGRLVLQRAVNEKKAAINTASFARGVYLLKVKSADKTAVKKIVLE
ncbi:MAG: leucyl aminopeptidase, partial [Bacteroidota bacterium]|nr:leucyl aminopeptidase [Bacteroidota bacterium]